MAADVLAENREAKETLEMRMGEFEAHKAQCEGRNKTFKTFTVSLVEFLSDTKLSLMSRVTGFNESEARRVQLGPAIPVGSVTLEKFAALADAFTSGCIALMEEAGLNWQQQGATHVQEQARVLEDYLRKATKASVEQEIEALRE